MTILALLRFLFSQFCSQVHISYSLLLLFLPCELKPPFFLYFNFSLRFTSALPLFPFFSVTLNHSYRVTLILPVRPYQPHLPRIFLPCKVISSLPLLYCTLPWYLFSPTALYHHNPSSSSSCTRCLHHLLPFITIITTAVGIRFSFSLVFIKAWTVLRFRGEMFPCCNFSSCISYNHIFYFF